MQITLPYLSVAMFLAANLVVANAQAASYAPRVGQPHPELTLPRIDTGEAVSLSGYRGKKVLLIHFASW